MNNDHSYTLVYDGDCAVCSDWARFLAARLPEGSSLHIVPNQWIRADLAKWGMSPTIYSRYVLLRDNSSSEIVLGHEAVGGALKLTNVRMWRLAGSVLLTRWLSPIFRAGYLAVSKYRRHLPGGTPSCKMPTSTPRGE